MLRHAALFALAISITSLGACNCGGPTSEEDGGVGTEDSGSTSSDAGSPTDSGPADAGAGTDAGPVMDAGPQADAGPFSDGGAAADDAGMPDDDAGITGNDAGAAGSDAGAAGSDAGTAGSDAGAAGDDAGGDIDAGSPDTDGGSTGGDAGAPTACVPTDGGTPFGVVVANDQIADIRWELNVASVDVADNAILVIHEDNGGLPGDLVSSRGLNPGANDDLVLISNRRLMDGDVFHAALYIDQGWVGAYEPGNDPPATHGGCHITQSFTVSVPVGTPDVEIDASGTQGSTDYAFLGVRPRNLVSATIGGGSPQYDPNITLRTNRRYRILIPPADGGAHPFQIHDMSSNVLLSVNSAGSLEGDAEIDWDESNPNQIVFTVDDTFEAQATDYECGNHPEMTGPITVVFGAP